MSIATPHPACLVHNHAPTTTTSNPIHSQLAIRASILKRAIQIYYFQLS